MIRNNKKFNEWLPAGFDGQFDWDFLRFSFDRGIMPMDYDACVESKGHRLIFETKDTGGVIPLGQLITLTNEWKIGATILLLNGKNPKSINGYSIYREGSYDPSIKIGDKKLKPCNYLDIAYIVKRWFCWSEGIDKPTRNEFENMLWVKDYDNAM